MGINGSLLRDQLSGSVANHFNLNSSLLQLFQISLLLRFNPALNQSCGTQTLFLCKQFLLFK